MHIYVHLHVYVCVYVVVKSWVLNNWSPMMIDAIFEKYDGSLLPIVDVDQS